MRRIKGFILKWFVMFPLAMVLAWIVANIVVYVVFNITHLW